MFRQVMLRVAAEASRDVKVKTASSGCRKISISAGVIRCLRSSGRIFRIMACRINALMMLIAIIPIGRIVAQDAQGESAVKR